MGRLFRVAMVALVVASVAAATYVGFQPERSGSIAFWGTVAAPNVLFAIVAALVARRDGVLADLLRPKWGDFSRAFVGAAALYLGAYAFAHSIAAVGTPREIWLVSLYGQLGDPRVLQSHAVAVGGVILIVAVAEELVWRWLVTSLVAEMVGSRLAWIASSLLYALAHVPTMWALRNSGGLDPIVPLAALGAGLVFGAMARAFGRLAPSILAHALFDWAIVMMFPLWGLSRLA